MPGGVLSFFAWFPGGRVFYERAASFSYSLVANRQGGWNIRGLENFPNINSRGGGIFQNLKLWVMKNTSCIFQPVHPR